MPRRARLSLPGIPWHIIQRGNNRAVCFHTEADYQFYLYYLKEFADKFGCEVHAYALMTNHVHLLLTPAKANSAGLLMKHLGQRYVQYINRTYLRSGTLWEGRFRSCLTQTEDYVLACYRYIELNPVRSGMVMKPQDYRWSSYHANGLGRVNALITPHDQYQRLARTDEIRSATNGNYALGSTKFQKQIEKALGRRVVRGVAGRPPKVEEPDDRQGEL